MNQASWTKKIFIAIGVLLFINFVVLGYLLFLRQPVPAKETRINDLRVIFLNVGQGDAILIQSPSQKNILIDGGPDRQIIYKLDQYIPIIDRKIDLMILTHPDPDHLNGLVEVLKRYPVSQVAYNGVSDPDPAYGEWQQIIHEKNIPTMIVDRRQILKIFDDISLLFLWPKESLAGQALKDDNPGSIVMKLVFGQHKFLFTGDADKKVEEELIKLNEDLTADVLKVGHHGSKTSSGLDFLEKIKSKYAVISVGKNKYGHPSFRVLRNLEKIKAQILRTDEMGDIIFMSDGQKLQLITKN